MENLPSQSGFYRIHPSIAQQWIVSYIEDTAAHIRVYIQWSYAFYYYIVQKSNCLPYKLCEHAVHTSVYSIYEGMREASKAWVYVWVYVCVQLLLLEACCILRFHASISACGVMWQSPSSFTAAGDSPPGGDSWRAGRREGMKHLMHVLSVCMYVKCTI